MYRYKCSRRDCIAGILCALIGTCIAGACLFSATIWPIGIAGLIFLPANGLFWVSRLYAATSELVVDSTGITAQLSVCRCHIPWTEVTAVALHPTDDLFTIAVYFRDYAHFYKRYRPLKRLIMGLFPRRKAQPLRLRYPPKGIDRQALTQVLEQYEIPQDFR